MWTRDTAKPRIRLGKARALLVRPPFAERSPKAPRRGPRAEGHTPGRRPVLAHLHVTRQRARVQAPGGRREHGFKPRSVDGGSACSQPSSASRRKPGPSRGACAAPPSPHLDLSQGVSMAHRCPWARRRLGRGLSGQGPPPTLRGCHGPGPPSLLQGPLCPRGSRDPSLLHETSAAEGQRRRVGGAGRPGRGPRRGDTWGREGLGGTRELRELNHGRALPVGFRFS